MWELDPIEGWALKNLCFWTVLLEKTLESPLDCKEIKQSILKEINPEYSLEGLMLKLKLQYFSHLIEKVPDAGKDWGQEGKGVTEDDSWIASPTQWIWVWANIRRYWRTGKSDSLRHRVTMSQTQLSSPQFSHSLVSDSLWPHEPQHARPPCPSPTPGVHPNPCPLCQWCHPTISSSVVPFSSCPQSFPASGSFQMSQLSTSCGQSNYLTT